MPIVSWQKFFTVIIKPRCLLCARYGHRLCLSWLKCPLGLDQITFSILATESTIITCPLCAMNSSRIPFLRAGENKSVEKDLCGSGMHSQTALISWLAAPQHISQSEEQNSSHWVFETNYQIWEVLRVILEPWLSQSRWQFLKTNNK